MGVKLGKSNLSNVPGPGQYEPNMENIKYRAPGYKLGSENRGRSTGDTGKTPGPGQYDLRRDLKGKDVRFGQGVRTSEKKNETPGPGYYSLPKVTAHMANYYKGSQKHNYNPPLDWEY
jgi:hypothetical protein